MKGNDSVRVSVKKSVFSQGKTKDQVLENPLLTYFKSLLLKKEGKDVKKSSRNFERR